LSGLKWPAIIAVIVGIGWLGTSGGVNWMYDNFTEATPGVDAEQDKIDEAGLTKLGGYLMMLWQYDKAIDAMEAAINRYGPQAPNYYYNYYRLAKCYERTGQYQRALNQLRDIMGMEAWNHDDRIPNRDNLALRAQKLKEVHELQ